MINICSRNQCPSCELKRITITSIHCPPDVLSLTTTCRQIHNETLLLPITADTFCGHYEGLKYAFKTLFNDAQMEAVQSLFITYMGVAKPQFIGLWYLKGLKSVILFNECGFALGRDMVTEKFEREAMRILSIGGIADKAKVKEVRFKEFLSILLDWDTLPSADVIATFLIK